MILASDRITEEQLDKLDAEHDGRILHIWQAAIPRRGKDAPDGAVAWECVFRAPKRRELAMFTQSIDSSVSAATRSTAPETLAKMCVLHVSGSSDEPSKAFDALLEKFPGIPLRVAAQLAKLSGFEAEEK